MAESPIRVGGPLSSFSLAPAFGSVTCLCAEIKDVLVGDSGWDPKGPLTIFE